jgi:hypothetical protein
MLKFTHKKQDDYIRDLLVRENDFITNLLEMYPLPETKGIKFLLAKIKKKYFSMQN